MERLWVDGVSFRGRWCYEPKLLTFPFVSPTSVNDLPSTSNFFVSLPSFRPVLGVVPSTHLPPFRGKLLAKCNRVVLLQEFGLRLCNGRNAVTLMVRI